MQSIVCKYLYKVAISAQKVSLMNNLWFDISMVALGSIAGGSIGFTTYLLTRFMFSS